jgi:DNA (cytosine-5)-methyltransferase 1
LVNDVQGGNVNELALFMGAGGGLLGAKLLGWRTVCGVEIDPYCREVVLRRQEEGFLSAFPVWDDVRTFDGRPWRGKVDIVTAGFPCQPFSLAGLRRGPSDDRNLWPATRRIISQVRPEFALLENVPGLISCGYVAQVYGEMAALGYCQEGDCVPASAVGAHFLGDRLWIAASSSTSNGLRRKRERPNPSRAFARDEFERLVERELQLCVPAGKGDRVSDGVAHRVDRLRALGNGQVPAVVQAAWEMLMPFDASSQSG